MLEGKANVLVIFPEGATTNGTGLIKFKKGAFASLLPVQPHVLKYKTLRGQPQHGDHTNYLLWMCFIVSTIYFSMNLSELPTFAPNDYFWQNHWDSSKEQKWEAYARAIREIMADFGDFQLHNSEMEDKL